MKKICANCNEEFFSRIIIDGRIINLRNRKYCLRCSPFGKYNTKRLANDPEAKDSERYLTKECVCDDCGRKYIYNRHKGHTFFRCNSCTSAAKRGRLKIRAVLLLGGRCSRCGYDKCLSALTFHHLNQERKEISLTLLDRVPWKQIEKELKKCILLCANCHAEEHSSVDSFKWNSKKE